MSNKKNGKMMKKGLKIEKYAYKIWVNIFKKYFFMMENFFKKKEIWTKNGLKMKKKDGKIT